VVFDVSVCALRDKETKRQATNMLNKEQNDEGSVARDDGFCTGADFINQKYV